MERAEAKRLMRQKLLARRRAVPEQAAQAAARAIVRYVLEAPEFRAAHRVGLYAALADELPTGPLREATLESGKRFLLPRMRAGGRLEFAEVARFEDLQPGALGVLEPPPEAPAQPLESGDLVLIPGVAFDRRGHRLGRGRGCYDRTFPPGEPHQPILFGVAYAFQIVDAVPHGPGDRTVEAVLTEQGIHRVGEAVRWQ